MVSINQLKVKIFADGADVADMRALSKNSLIRGFTTNPTLVKMAGVTHYEHFAKDVLNVITERPVSFEVLSDDFNEMYHQAHHIARWGDNVFVKIPVTNSQGLSSVDVIQKLSRDGIKLNITAAMTVGQIEKIVAVLSPTTDAVISLFAGRIADTGRDPLPYLTQSLNVLSAHNNLQLIWASPRELLNIFQAHDIGCHIITVTKNILDKLILVDKDLEEYSLETVRMFYNDAKAAKLIISPVAEESLEF